MLESCDDETSLSPLAIQYEMARGGLTEAEVVEQMCDIISILRKSIKQGFAGTGYADRVLGFQSGALLTQA